MKVTFCCLNADIYFLCLQQYQRPESLHCWRGQHRTTWLMSDTQMCKQGWKGFVCAGLDSVFVCEALSCLIVLLVLNECHYKALVYLTLFFSRAAFTHNVFSLWFEAYWKSCFVLSCLFSFTLLNQSFETKPTWIYSMFTLLNISELPRCPRACWLNPSV